MNIIIPTETLSMNHKQLLTNRCILLSIFLLFNFSIFGQSPLPQQLAVDYLKLKSDLVCHTSEKYGQDPHQAIAFGFPKLVKHFESNGQRNTDQLEQLYIHLGSRESDVQIGEFMLKTSFVEQLETIVSNHSSFFQKFAFITEYKVADERSIRINRLKRMKDISWQIDYLFAFKAIADSCFFGVHFENMEEKNAFYSIAFDLGFKAKLNDIKNCYNLFKEDVKNDRRVDRCRQSASLTKEFFAVHTPIFDCKYDFVEVK